MSDNDGSQIEQAQDAESKADPSGDPISPPMEIEESDELLLRQVHPEWIREGAHSSQTFRPTPKDQGKLSIARGSLYSAQEAYDHHKGDGHATAGVVAVDANEVGEVGLQAIHDATPFEAHGFIDFRDLNKNRCLKISKKLNRKAKERGWLFPKNAPA